MDYLIVQCLSTCTPNGHLHQKEWTSAVPAMDHLQSKDSTMYCHGLPAFQRPDFDSVKLIMTLSVKITYMMCIAVYMMCICVCQYHVLPRATFIKKNGLLLCQTPWTTFQTLDFNCAECITTISYLVGALSPVNHTGLHQGWTQTSLYLLVIHFRSHYTVGTQHRNLHQGDLFYS